MNELKKAKKSPKLQINDKIEGRKGRRNGIIKINPMPTHKKILPLVMTLGNRLIKLTMVQTHDVPVNRYHADTTTVLFYGEYDVYDGDLTEEELKQV